MSLTYLGKSVIFGASGDQHSGFMRVKNIRITQDTGVAPVVVTMRQGSGAQVFNTSSIPNDIVDAFGPVSPGQDLLDLRLTTAPTDSVVVTVYFE